MKKIILSLALAFSGYVSAQQNILWDANFWKTNPSVEQVKQKISEGNSPTQPNDRAFDPATIAILNNASYDVITYLLSLEGNHLEKESHHKRTYLLWAAMQNNIPVVKFLLEKGANAKVLDSHLNTPALLAAGRGNATPELCDLLLKYGMNFKATNDRGADVLLASVANFKDIKEADYFVKKGLSLKSTDNAGDNAVFYATRNGNKTIVNQLIKKKVNAKAVNKKGENLFFAAAEGSRAKSNDLDFMKFVEGLGINPNQKNNDGVTPLFTLSGRHKDVAVVSYFIEKGNDVNQTNKNGVTPLMNAAARNTAEIVTLLADKTANINAKNNEGHSALTLAVRSNSPEIVSLLVKKGADVKLKDNEGNSLAFHLLESYNPRNAQQFDEKWAILVQNGVNFTENQAKANTLYHLAISKNDVKLLEKIASLGININAKNADGLTPLHKAIMTAKNTKLVETLLKMGADKSIKTDFDESAYDLAQENEALKGKDISFLKN